MSALRTQIYLTAEQRAGLDDRARIEDKTMAHLIREAVDAYLGRELDDTERQRALDETYGSCPGLADRVPTRDEWERAPRTASA